MSGLEGVAAAASFLTLCARIVKLAQKVEDRYVDYKLVEGKRLEIERLNRHLNTDLECLREIKGPSPALSDYQDCTQHFEERLCAQEKLPEPSRLSFRLRNRLKVIPQLILKLLDDFTTQLKDIQERVTKDLAVKNAMVRFKPYQKLQEEQEKFDGDTREWVIERIDAWYARGCTDDLTWKNVFLVVGPAGVGKTVISGVVCERGGCFAQPEAEKDPETQNSSSPQVSPDKVGIQVGACVSIKSQIALNRDPLSILKVVAYQLGCVAGLTDTDWKDYFRNRLVSFAKKLAKKQDYVVVVVMDGLDECQDPQFGSWIVDAWITEMPRFFALFATSRDDYSFEDSPIEQPTIPLQAKPEFKIDFNDSDTAHLQSVDMRKAVQKMLQTQSMVLTFLSPSELEPAVEFLLERAQGRFLYFDGVKAQLAAAAKAHKAKLKRNDAKLSPQDIAKQYKDYFPVGIKASAKAELKRLSRRLTRFPELYDAGSEEYPHKDSHPPEVQLQTTRERERYVLATVIGPVLACPNPLPLDMFSFISLGGQQSTSRLPNKKVEKVIDSLRRSSLFSERNGCIQLRHDVTRTVLSKEFDIDETCGHEHLVSACINAWKERQDTYAAEFLTYHIVKSGRQVNKGTLKKMLEEAADSCYSDLDFFSGMGIPQNEVLEELSMIGWDLSETFEETWKSLDSRKFIRIAIVIILARKRQWLVHDIEIILLTLRELFVGAKDVQIETYVFKEVAKVLADLHRLDESLKWFQAAEKNTDKCCEALQSSVFRGLAELYLLLGQFTSAKDYYSKCPGGPAGVHHAILESKIGLAFDGIAQEETIKRLRNALQACQVDASTNPIQLMECRTLLAVCLTEQGNYEEAEATLRQAQAEFSELDSVAYAESLYELGRMLERRGRYDESMNALQTALKTFTEHYSEEHGKVADCRTRIALVLSRRGRHDEAVKVQRKTNDLLLRIYLREENPKVVGGLHNLALYLQNQGQLDDAEKLFRKVLVIEEMTHGSKHPAIATTLSNLASLMREKGVLDEAEDHCRTALAIDRKKFPRYHPRIAAGLNDLASVLKELGKLDEAEELYTRALEIERENFGNEHFEVAKTLNNLGLVLKDKGELDEAEDLHRRALVIDKKTFGEEHFEVAKTLNNLASVLQDKGKLEKAEELYREALEIEIGNFGDKHFEVGKTLNNLGLVLKDKGRLEEAETHYREALKIEKTNFGDKHFEVAKTLNNLGLVLKDKGKLDEAEELYRKALEIEKTNFGDKHFEVAKTLNNLALVLHDKGRFDEAEKHYREALEIEIGNFGDKHFEVAKTLGNLGSVLYSKRDYGTAGEIYKKAMEITKATLGDKHSDYAYSLHNLATVTSRQGRYEDANSLFEESLTIRRTTFGAEHRYVASSYWAWAENLKDQGNVIEAWSKWNAACKAYKESLGAEHEEYKRCMQWWCD